MIIEGKKNLEFMKRALLSHLVNCSVEALGPEIAETNLMLDAVQHNLERYKDSDPTPVTKLTSVFFR